MLDLNTVYHSDAFDLLNRIPDGSIDMVLCDPPYGITDIAWDKKLDTQRFLNELMRVTKRNGVVVLFCNQPFTTELMNCGMKWFREHLIWAKNMPTQFLNAKFSHMRTHEEALIFRHPHRRATRVFGHVEMMVMSEGGKNKTYNPQMRAGEPYKGRQQGVIQHYDKPRLSTDNPTGERYPTTVIQLPLSHHERAITHGTSKPIALFDYLIRTYSNTGDIILDPCVGSGTTALAARQTGRNFIVGDMTQRFIEITNQRLSKPFTPMFDEVKNLPTSASQERF